MRRTMMAGTAMLLLCGIAAADSDFNTVKLSGGGSIDVPAGAQGDFTPHNPKSDTLLYFVATTRSDGDLDCMLSRYRYSKKLTRPDSIKKLTDDRRDTLCTAGHANADVGESESLTVAGFPAGRCAASYEDGSDKKQPGRVDAVMGVAAPGAFYLLSCTLHEPSADDATHEWMLGWNDEVHHVQQSFRP